MKQNGDKKQPLVINYVSAIGRTVYFYAPIELALSFKQYGEVTWQRGELWTIVVDVQFSFDEVLDILRSYK